MRWISNTGMWPNGSSAGTRPDWARAGITIICASVLAAGLLACRRQAPPETPSAEPAADLFSVLCYNLDHYGLEDRDQDGQRDDPKPLPAREAVVRVIASAAPDILALQGIGGPGSFAELKQALEDAGLHYAFEEYLRLGDSENNLAVLSRLPILSMQSHTNDTYRIGDETFSVRRGFLDVDIGVDPAYNLRLLVADLKSKTFHEAGQTEMRRNEARLLNNHIRAILREDPAANLLVAGSFHDSASSAALQTARGRDPVLLSDLRPADPAGEVWTFFDREEESYRREDYLLVSKGLRAEWEAGPTRLLSGTDVHAASAHRPLLAVFHAYNR